MDRLILSYYGIGPKIGTVALPYLFFSIFFTVQHPSLFVFDSLQGTTTTLAGIFFIVFGILFYIKSLRTFVKGWKQQRLVTEGTFALCQNPLYASFIVFIFPGFSLLFMSWLVFLTSVIAYNIFRNNIHREYDQLERMFGDEYLEYRRNTTELFPRFPFFKHCR